jgi:hypothetical protein
MFRGDKINVAEGKGRAACRPAGSARCIHSGRRAECCASGPRRPRQNGGFLYTRPERRVEATPENVSATLSMLASAAPTSDP